MIERDVGLIVERPDELRNRTRAEAFASLIDRLAIDRAYRYATLMLGNPSDAEDAVHDAALTAWRRFRDLRDPARFDAWFGRILTNACRDRLRARRRAPASLDGDPLMAIQGGRLRASDDHEAVARRSALEAALRTLTPDHREVVVLRFYVDLTIDKIAARTGTRAGTVKSRLHFALRYLRSAVEAESEGRSPR